MSQKASRFFCITFAMFLLALWIPTAAGQVTSTGIHGNVKDSSGAVVPNVNIVLTDMATQSVTTTHTEADGGFVFVNLQSGNYRITATVNGFQTAVIDNVKVDSGRTVDLNIKLVVGASTEKIEVTAAAVQLETSSNELGATINNAAINYLPYTSRDSLNFALLSPGAQTTSGYSTFNGLPNASMNITIDGMNANSQRFKSGGTSFYEFGAARLDAIEEVTVSTGGLDADAAGGGAMQIRFTTKRGTDRYRFHLAEQFYNEDLNANTYFNKLQGVHRSKSRTQDYAGSVGGPLLPFIPYFKNRVFFFINFEDVPGYGGSTYTTTVLSSDAYNGNFTYLGTDGKNHTVNLLTTVAAAGCATCYGSINSVTGNILSQIKATQTNATGYLPISGQPYWQTMQYGQPTYTGNIYPTVRLDYMISSKFSWHGTWNDHRYKIDGTPNYPGGPSPSNSAYLLNSPVTSNTLDMTITPHLLNSIKFGTEGNMEYFYNPSDPHQWASQGNVNYTLWNASGTVISPLIPNNLPFKRNNPVWQVNDAGTWVKGTHTVAFGMNFLRTSFYEQSFGSAGVPNVYFGIQTTDPVNNILSQTSGALPFINTSSTTDINNAQLLYSLLTGRINSYSTSFNVDETSHAYKQFAPLMQRFALNTLGLYVKDSWRLRPNLSLNFGLHWELDGSIRNTNGIDSWPTNLYGPSTGNFQPGKIDSSYNPVVNIKDSVYTPSKVTPGPNIGFAWSPEADHGLLGRIIGHGKTVVAGSYGIQYYSEGLNTISNLQCCNTGTTQSASAAAAIGANPGIYSPTSAAPTMVYNPTTFATTTSLMGYPTNGGTTLYYANPDLKSPYVQSWNFHIQREVAPGNIIDVRYVGNKATHMWHYQNINETNIFENGFLQEFQNAQSNLAIANGISVAQLTALPTPKLTTSNFSNQGKAGQVALPILQAAFGANGSNAALSTSSGFGSSTYITYLEQGNVGTFASSLASTSTATTYCRIVGSNFTPCANAGYTQNNGYAMNLFRAQPYANNVYYQNDDGNSNYNGLQVEYRRAPRHGLSVDAHFTWSHTLSNMNNLSDQTATYTFRTLRNGRLDYGPTSFDHRATAVFYFQYDLPFGRDKWVNIDNKVLRGILGGWTLGDQTSIISGSPNVLTCGRYTLNATADGGCLFGNGLTMSSLLNRTATFADYTSSSGAVVKAGQFDSSCNCFHTNVADIAPSPGSGGNGSVLPQNFQPYYVAGSLGSRYIYYGKTTYTMNLSLTKTIAIRERFKLRVFAEASNFLNHPYFAQGSTSVTSTSFGNITSASGSRTMFLRSTLDF